MIVLILLILVAVLCFLYLNGTYNENYWKKRGIPFYSKNKYLGPLFEFLYAKQPGFKIMQSIYKTHPEAPAVGVVSLFGRALLIKDLTNVQYVLATDFNSFSHRGMEINEGDILADSIIFNNGKRWKLMRQHITPLFTSSKLKSMYYIIDKSAQDFIDYLKKNPQYLKGNAFETLSTFCSAAIGGSVFGVGTESIFDSPFLKMAQKASQFTLKMNFFFAIANASPKISNFFGIKLFKEHEGFFIDAIKQIIRARERENVKRHDFADICVSLQKNDVLKDHDTGLELKPTDEFLAAQAFFFFIAGVEPSATTMYITLIELGRHPEVLAKVHEEIDNTFEKHENITHDVLCEMEYLDMAINEAMRLHPPIGFVSRQCVQDTVLPVGNIKIEKGTTMFIATYGMHHDETYFPEPNAFKPERFSKENKHNFMDAAYMPFGKGNRICIGVRYAQLQVKAGLVHLLRNYTIRTILHDNEDEVKYKRELVQLRVSNADVEFIPRL
ncbi:cytochrome P450 6j1-like [Epargyreus clarus]|uniref:cytochrome P450 6j1-like n=1 Tax=Epargyreus clarus TaxID=520877 RepID=UPI003C2B476E